MERLNHDQILVFGVSIKYICKTNEMNISVNFNNFIRISMNLNRDDTIGNNSRCLLQKCAIHKNCVQNKSEVT